jgi:periplasmic divalent cation tolerance protein
MKRSPRGPRGSAAVVILVAYPKGPAALRAARALVRERLLACATVQGGARAVYRWKGRIHEEPGTLLWGKTTAAAAGRAMEAIREAHPDEVPEILLLPVAKGNTRYLAWLRASVEEGE